MKLSFSPPADERLQAAQHKAGYYAFMTTFAILLLLGFCWTLFPDYITPAVMYMALFFPGALVFLVIVGRAGWFTYMRDFANASPGNRRRSLLILFIQTAFFSTGMGFSHYYIRFGADDQPTVKESVLYALAVGVFWGLWMGAFYVFRMRKKKGAEAEEE